MYGARNLMSEDFELFLKTAEPRLRRALVAAYGQSLGREAAVDSLSWAWQNWTKLSTMQNPVGYLFRVGQTSARRQIRHSSRAEASKRSGLNEFSRNGDGVASPERNLDLPIALKSLSVQQRTAIVLVHGYGLPLREVAQTMQISVASVREHTKRALDRLRPMMEVSDVE